MIVYVLVAIWLGGITVHVHGVPPITFYHNQDYQGVFADKDACMFAADTFNRLNGNVAFYTCREEHVH